MKRLVIVIFIIFALFLTFSLYRTYAYDTSVVEETPSTTDLEYTFKIGNSSIKQITIDSGETKYYDVVLGNPNPAKISYSIYYEMVSPSTKPDGFSIGYTSKSTGKSTGKVDKEGNITLNIEVTNTSSSAVTVKIGSVAGYVNGGDLVLESGQTLIPEKKIPATSIIEALDDGTTGDNGSGVYKVSHEAIASDSSATGSEIKASDDYRYYGASPNNYICLDMEGGSTCSDRSLYRIIGSIYEENAGENLIKVIKATPLTNGSITTYAWDSNYNIWATPTNGNYSNSLTSGASLMILLNSGDWWSGTNTYANYGLTATAKSMVNTSRYYLSGFDNNSVKTTAVYDYERGKNRYDTGRPLYWDGYVGLMYPSDYGYAAGNSCATGTNLGNYDSSCKSKDWLYNSSKWQWLMSQISDSFNGVYGVRSTGSVYFSGGEGTGLISPVFYLKSNVGIIDGNGTLDNPYLLK